MKRISVIGLLLGWFYISTKFTYDVNQSDPSLRIGWGIAILSSVLAFNLPIWVMIWAGAIRRRRKIRKLEAGDSKPKNRLIFRTIKFAFVLTLIYFGGMEFVDEIDKQTALLAEDPVTFSADSNGNPTDEKFISGKSNSFLTWTTIGKTSKNPVVWQTCKSINVYLNAANNETAEEDVRWVINYVDDVTGLNFRFAGLNNKALVKQVLAKPYTVQITYDRRENFVKSFNDEKAIGVGGNVYRAGEIESGQIALYIPAMNDADETLRRNVILHEFGHVLGLGHTTTPSDIMYPETNGNELTNFNEEIIEYFLDNPGCAS